MKILVEDNKMLKQIYDDLNLKHDELKLKYDELYIK